MKLCILCLPSCCLPGSIPEQVTEFSRLRVLRLSQNVITGSIPANFSTITAMQVFDVTRNNISGTVGAGQGSKGRAGRQGGAEGSGRGLRRVWAGCRAGQNMGREKRVGLEGEGAEGECRVAGEGRYGWVGAG